MLSIDPLRTIKSLVEGIGSTFQGSDTSRDQPADQLKSKWPGNPREDTARRMPGLISLAKKPWPAVHGDAAGRRRANCFSLTTDGKRASLRTVGLLTSRADAPERTGEKDQLGTGASWCPQAAAAASPNLRAEPPAAVVYGVTCNWGRAGPGFSCPHLLPCLREIHSEISVLRAWDLPALNTRSSSRTGYLSVAPQS
jgi:hypothetical protein